MLPFFLRSLPFASFGFASLAPVLAFPLRFPSSLFLVLLLCWLGVLAGVCWPLASWLLLVVGVRRLASSGFVFPLPLCLLWRLLPGFGVCGWVEFAWRLIIRPDRARVGVSEHTLGARRRTHP